ncbi:hypothetical protein GF324_10220 [bacterium]|nr:hypothetical protein [bacterium]
MFEWYVQAVKTHPIISSAIQVAILGTIGELLAGRIRLGRWYLFGPGPWRLLAKIVVWGFLGITFKYAFTGFFGFVAAIADKGIWPAVEGRLLWRALSASVFTNILFGPMMMLFHRWTDNWIESKEMDWPSLQKAWWTLIWFWIPAHTVTFILPDHFRVGLAALWAIVLGVILGFFARAQQARET